MHLDPRWLLLLGTACSLHERAPVARVRPGPELANPPLRLLALPTTCRAAEVDVCQPGHARAVDAAARMALEFDGFTLIDSERVNQRLAVRREQTSASESGFGSSESTDVDRVGVTWADATPDERHGLIAELRADGFLESELTMGPAAGLAQQRTVAVQLRVTRITNGALAWQSRCAVETGDYNSTEQAVELATRCALASVAVLEVPR